MEPGERHGRGAGAGQGLGNAELELGYAWSRQDRTDVFLFQPQLSIGAAAPADREIPPEGAIEEAVESAKVFCGAQAPAFVNGVLAAVLREVRENPLIS